MARVVGAFSSPLVSFEIGEHKKTIQLHRGALLPLSEYFSALFGDAGGFEEAHTGVVDFSDIAEEDFDRFCTFVYTGDYIEPPAVAEPEDEIEGRKDTVRETHEGLLTNKTRIIKSRSPAITSFDQGERLTKLFKKKAYCLISPGQVHLEKCRATVAHGDKDNVTAALLANARLYSFAKQRMIDDLWKLSLQKIHNILDVLPVTEERYEDVLAVTVHAYEEEYAELRDLLVCYQAAHFAKLGNFGRFFRFVRDEPRFSYDLLQMLHAVSIQVA